MRGGGDSDEGVPISGGQLYETIGATYSVTRRTEPRIAAQVWDCHRWFRNLTGLYRQRQNLRTVTAQHGLAPCRCIPVEACSPHAT